MRLLGCILPLLILVATLRAEPLDRRQVPADAKWLIHLDADAGRDSKVGQTMLDLLRAIPQSQMALEKAQACFGMDLTSDVSSYTAYGKNFVPDGGVLIVRGKLNRAKLLALLQTIPTLKTVNVHQHDVFIWTETDPQNAARPGHESAAVLFDDHTVVLAHDLQLIGDALDMLDGKGKSLDGAASPLAALPPDGTVIEAGATGLSGVPELPDHSPVVRQCDSGMLYMGERAGEAFLHGSIATSSQEVAHQLQALLVGLQAAAQFNAIKNADQLRLLLPLKVSTEGQTVRVDWQFSSQDVSSIIASQLKAQLGIELHPQPTGKEN
jgi:hypothetical protein